LPGNRRPQGAHPQSGAGLGPGFIDEDQTARVDTVLIGHPLQGPARYVRPVALAGDQRLFLHVSFSL